MKTGLKVQQLLKTICHPQSIQQEIFVVLIPRRMSMKH